MQKKDDDDPPATGGGEIAILYEPLKGKIAKPHAYRNAARGKYIAGAKLAISIVEGLAYLANLSWANFAKAMTLTQAIERYNERHGFISLRFMLIRFALLAIISSIVILAAA